MDAKDNAYLEFLEAQFKREKLEAAEVAKNAARGHSWVDTSANTLAKRWMLGAGSALLTMGGIYAGGWLWVGFCWFVNTGLKGPFFR